MAECMPCFANFSVTLQTEILPTEISDFLKYFFSLLLIPCYYMIIAFAASTHHIFREERKA